MGSWDLLGVMLTNECTNMSGQTEHTARLFLQKMLLTASVLLSKTS